MIYFDNAATTFRKPKSVARAVFDAMQRYASPGRGGYPAAMEAAEKVFSCRELVGKLFSCPAEQVVFTSNATHGLNVAIHTVVKPGAKVVISGFEHNAVWRPLLERKVDICVAGRRLFDREDTLEAFARELKKGADVVICTHVSNVFGYILPVEEIARMCRKYGVPFVLDASQSAGMLPVSMENLQADFIAMPGHKGLYGPQGTGVLLCSRLPKPLICGGTGSNSADGQMPDFLPDRGEAGTHNVPGICGLLEGVRFVENVGTANILAHERQICRRIRNRLAQCDDIHLFAGDEAVQSGVLSFRVRGWDCEEAAEKLAKMGCAVRAGLHCAPLAHESAGTLESGTIRISPSVFSEPWEADFLASRILALSMQEK